MMDVEIHPILEQDCLSKRYNTYELLLCLKLIALVLEISQPRLLSFLDRTHIFTTVTLIVFREQPR